MIMREMTQVHKKPNLQDCQAFCLEQVQRIMISDIRCKANTLKFISRKICKHNCKYWKHKKCSIGY